MGNFRELAVYRCAVQIADELRLAVLGWSSFDRWTIGTQLVRAADSIGANIAESSGRQGVRDEFRFLIVARGSAFEAEHLAERAAARGLLDPASVERTREVSRRLNGLIRRRQDLMPDT